MRITVSFLLISTLTLSACGGLRDSRINPVNWFGSSETAPAPQQTSKNPLIPEATGLFDKRPDEDIYLGQPIDAISSLVVERVPGGAIIRATGLAAAQGVYDLQLTPAVEDEIAVDGVLTYRLEGLRRSNAPQGATATREVTVARKVTDQTLSGARIIRVEALNNARQVRR